MGRYMLKVVIGGWAQSIPIDYNMEVKTGRQTWEELPAGYYLQVQHYLDILHLLHGSLTPKPAEQEQVY